MYRILWPFTGFPGGPSGNEAIATVFRYQQPPLLVVADIEEFGLRENAGRIVKSHMPLARVSTIVR